MYQDLNQRLNQAANAAARKEKLTRRLKELRDEHRHAAAMAERLRQQLAKEERDVTRMEGASLTGLFYSILGSREEQLQKERQEALAAQLKYDEAVLTVSDLAAELEAAQRELNAVEAEAAAYPALLREKERLITSAQGAGADQLFRLAEQERSAEWDLQQLREARDAGLRAERTLDQVVESLRSAKGWGTWDMLGGGMIATAVKHSRMDDARAHAHRAQQALATFRRELKDVYVDIDPGQVSIDGFSRFADYFFDGLIMDWVVQSKINNSLGEVERTQSQVRQMLSNLDSRFHTAEVELARLRREREEFVASYNG